MRTPLIAGNWKMNLKLEESKDLVQSIHYSNRWPGMVDIIVSPPITSLHFLSDILKDSYIDLAAQNMFHQDSGAFTGEVSPSQILDAGANYVLLGHSERRQLFNETDELINKKMKAAIKHQITPILCIGETLDQREENNYAYVLATQVISALNEIDIMDKNIIIAYEPVWAIGTGRTASPDQVAEAHLIIRSILDEKYSKQLADKTRILYGGSVKPSNAKELLSLKDVDGALVGGASLNHSDFINIINCAKL